ncbi:MAG: autotransporter outer membrane beta-barrel domain-containing protein, partial [Steroidobacteraceae bacterium]|nr:autotransporter outer membrane beta-barrel domain-containing protein [Steroidobacteraceae bacterium]
FFFDVCGAPSGTLATRCAETPSGLGNLSGDSESSLNPSHNLGHNQSPVSAAQARSKEARERGEKLREGEAGDGNAVQVAAGPWSLLVNVRGTWFERDGKGAADPERDFEGDSRAVEIGTDYRLSERVVLGALLGLERTDYEFDAENPGVNFTPASIAGDAESDNLYLTLFGSWAVGGRGFLELAGGYEQGDGTYRRNSVFQESTRTLPQVNVRAAGESDTRVTWLGVNAGFDVDRGALSVGPYVGLTSTSARLDAYTERDRSNSGLNMRFGSTTRDSLLAHAGVRASYVFSTGAGVLVPQLRVEYQHEFEDDPQTVTARFDLDTAGTEYRLKGRSVDNDAVNAGLSLSTILPNGWMPFVDYSVLFGHETFDRQRATLGLRVEF